MPNMGKSRRWVRGPLFLVAFASCTFIAAAASAQERDEVRFRWGISAGAGPSFGDYSGILGGGDLRLGVQINQLIGVYGDAHLAAGSVTLKNSNASGVTGVFAGTGMVDFTFAHRAFVAAGGGFGVLNNPSGPVLDFRAGGYPLMSRNEFGRRRGLMLSVDLRPYFTSSAGASFTIVEMTGNIGYEAF